MRSARAETGAVLAIAPGGASPREGKATGEDRDEGCPVGDRGDGDGDGRRGRTGVGRGRSHAGFHSAQLTSPGGEGAAAYGEAIKGPYLGSAQSLDPGTDTVAEKSLIKRNWFQALIWNRGMPVKGVQFGNPFDPMRPVKMIVPRNGVGSGQVVLSAADGLRGVSASLTEFKGPGGAAIPAAVVPGLQTAGAGRTGTQAAPGPSSPLRSLPFETASV